MIRVLRLGSSIDLVGETPIEERAAAIAARMLAGASGEEVETVLKIPKPDGALPGVMERWLNEVNPDLVCFVISSHWCEAENIAERMRDFGRVGNWIGARLRGASRRYTPDTNALARGAREIALLAVPGKPPFQPDEAASAIEDSLRRIVRREHVGVVVAGSPYSPALDGGRRAQERARRRREAFFMRLRDACERLHVAYTLPPHASDAFTRSIRTSDGLHFTPAMHRRMGEIQGALMVSAWQESGTAAGETRAGA
jgi:hypothetical protein